MDESPIGQMARWGHLDLGQIQQASLAVLTPALSAEIVMLFMLGERPICIVAPVGRMRSIDQGRRAASYIGGCEIRDLGSSGGGGNMYLVWEEGGSFFSLSI